MLANALRVIYRLRTGPAVLVACCEETASTFSKTPAHGRRPHTELLLGLRLCGYLTVHLSGYADVLLSVLTMRLVGERRLPSPSARMM
jgi:hypothetical protein